jgi:hypothetical protein
MSSVNYIDTLPTELLGHLLSFAVGVPKQDFMASYDMLYTVSLVSKKWHDSLKFASIWQQTTPEDRQCDFLRVPHCESGIEPGVNATYDAVRNKRANVLNWLLDQDASVCLDLPSIYLDIYGQESKLKTFKRIYQKAESSGTIDSTRLSQILVAAGNCRTAVETMVVRFVGTKGGPVYDPYEISNLCA